MIATIFHVLRWLSAAVAAAVAGLAAGFVWFAETTPWAAPGDTTHTDAIVVLTGGVDRIPAGVALLRQGLARKLFVSGVHPDVELTAMLRDAGVANDGPRDGIVLGHAAGNTRGNATETAEWMAREGFHSLRLVTANYHLRRAERELRRAMPDITFVLHPVVPGQMKREWWAWPGTAALLAGEYVKYLWSFVRPRSSP